MTQMTKKKNTKPSGLWLLTMACLPLSSWALTIEESLLSAIDHNPVLHEQYARYQSVLSDLDEVDSGFLPQVTLRAAVGSEQTNERAGFDVDENLDREELSLEITQLLFDGYETTANSKRLSYEAEAERLQLLASTENLALQVTEVYLNARKAQALLELTERHVADHEQVLQDIIGLAEKGFSNEADIAQVSARLANARASLVAAENNLQDNAALFYQVVGQFPDRLTDPISDPSILPPNLNTALDWAKQSHPQLQAAVADISAAREQVKASRSGFYPKFTIEGVANRNDNIGGIEGVDEDYRVMLVMEYDLFNGGRDESRTKASSWRYNEAIEIRRNAELELVTGTRFAWNAHQALDRQKELLRSSVDASSLAEAGYLTQFKLGKRSLLDLLNAKVEVFIARQRYLNTRYDYDQAAYRLLNATGRLGYALRVNFPAEWFTE